MWQQEAQEFIVIMTSHDSLELSYTWVVGCLSRTLTMIAHMEGMQLLYCNIVCKNHDLWNLECQTSLPVIHQRWLLSVTKQSVSHMISESLEVSNYLGTASYSFVHLHLGQILGSKAAAMILSILQGTDSSQGSWCCGTQSWPPFQF